MRVLLYGDGEISGSGGWCYAESLRDMGHEVINFSNGDGLGFYATSILARAWQRMRRGVLEVHRRAHICRLLKKVEQVRPETVIILKGLYLGPEDVSLLRARTRWTVLINHDDFFSRNRNNWSHFQHNALRVYDYIFTTNERNVAEVRPLNPRVEFFPFAYYPRIHRPVEIPWRESAVWDVDVVFVGTWERERCRLLEELVRRVRASYAVWGLRWERISRASPLAPYLRRRPVLMDNMAKAIGGAKIALGFLRKENRDDHTTRTFEIPACGGLFLAERTQRHRQFYEEGSEAEFFDPDSPDELAAKVTALLNDKVHREAIRTAGMTALKRQRHTYRDRMERLLEVYDHAQRG